MSITSVVMLFVVLWTVLPTSDALRRRWYLTSARAEMRDLLAGGQSRRLDGEALFRDADRIGQLAALQPAADDEHRDDLRQALEIFGRAAPVRRGPPPHPQPVARASPPLGQDPSCAPPHPDPPRP